MVRVPLVVRGDASFFEKDQLKISGGTQNLFLDIWWYAVEKRLGTPGLNNKEPINGVLATF